MNHIWLVKLHRKADKDALGKTGGLQVKGGLCAVIDHIQQDVTVKVHWVDFAVQNESFRQVLSNFGDVLEISNDNWSVAGFEHETSTTRVVRMRLKEGVVLDDLPHLFKFGSCSVLLVAPGRSPLCLRCRRQGHIRRDCQTPRFGVCRVFGHESQDCARSYGRVTQTIIPTDDVQENIMDAEEAEKSAPNSNIKEHVGEVQDTDAKIAGGTMPDSQDLTKATEERAETVCTQEAPLLSQASEEEDLSDCTETTTEEEKADATGATAARGKRLRTGIPKLTEERTERKVKRLEHGVTLQMLRNLATSEQRRLLDCYNNIWWSGQVPEAWRTAIVAPILKSNKPANELSSYRPVSLTSAACKVMEAIALARLEWVARACGFLADQQTGFRRRRCTADSIADVVSTLEDARASGDLAMLLLIDVKGAFDGLPHAVVQQALDLLGIDGNLRRFLSSFLNDRTLRVRVGHARSTPHGVTLQMLRNLATSEQRRLLDCYNNIWWSGQVPEAWRTAIVAPILKSNKPANELSSYRPVSLTSAACKVMEAIALARLEWVARACGFLADQQTGFRRRRCTADSIADVVSTLEDARASGDLAMLLLIDVKGAFDGLPHAVVQQALDLLGIDGNLRRFLSSFLNDRTLRCNTSHFELCHCVSCSSSEYNAWPQVCLYSIDMVVALSSYRLYRSIDAIPSSSSLGGRHTVVFMPVMFHVTMFMGDRGKRLAQQSGVIPQYVMHVAEATEVSE
ncbi:hypothetical protein HPB49_024672 [Dermacentor silvarum]|uniref:Uncharacterized protein n=1 Tax=Dermacentor silvarum TaxID=543639 RepID=A0ACB8DHB4_DERSI|nr:hypothetical protein HPB49_024672 [Dermacentor silvarum]